MRSHSRPGVAATMAGRFDSTRSCSNRTVRRS